MVPLALSVRVLMAFCWNRHYYHESCLSFDLRTAPFIFNMFAEALHWLLALLLPFITILHYLDDFIAVVPPHQDHLVDRFGHVWHELTGFLDLIRNTSKDGQGTTLDCLGIEIDTI